MKEFLDTYRPLIENRLEIFLEDSSRDLNKWGPFLRSRILEYTLRGKMIRGALVFLGAALADEGFSDLDSASDAAAAMELLQSFLLIHDDIMDQDDTRRGAPAIHKQFRDMAISETWSDPGHSAISLGICAGDIAAFWAVEILSGLKLPESTYRKILSIASREIALVGAAQMQDVVHGVDPEDTDINSILDVYRYKTGRYTFSLPLMLGWLIAGGDDTGVSILAELGEEMGVIFQIQDDYIGLFGDPENSGKPNTSDVEENKKTLYRYFLFDSDAPVEIRSLFGTQNLQSDHIRNIQDSCHTHGVLEKTAEIRKISEQSCALLIEKLSDRCGSKSINILDNILMYIGNRGS
ncbi:polyprenyl synthetase family protein [Spirochaeta dissipatitropha]